MTSPARFYKSLDLGDPAPRLTLPAVPGGSAALNDCLGKKKILLFFYAGDFIGGRTDSESINAGAAASLWALSSARDKFEDADARVAAISRDSPARHARLAELLTLKIPLLSDADGDVGEQYGLLPENRWAGSSGSYDFAGCVVVLDANGRVRFRQTADRIGPPADTLPAFLRSKLEADEGLRFDEPSVLGTDVLLRVVAEIK
jgi:peroxiredoxin Q/BCP